MAKKRPHQSQSWSIWLMSWNQRVPPWPAWRQESHCLLSEEIHPPVYGKDNHSLLPMVEKDEVILKDEIGRGSFGTV